MAATSRRASPSSVRRSRSSCRASATRCAIATSRSSGSLVDRSMALATTALGNQVPETIYLARRARELGAVAASAFGAGFRRGRVGDDRRERRGRIRRPLAQQLRRELPAPRDRCALARHQPAGPARVS